MTNRELRRQRREESRKQKKQELRRAKAESFLEPAAPAIPPSCDDLLEAPDSAVSVSADLAAAQAESEQIEAELAALRRRNRENASHSTGPRTASGKAASSQNARRHGLCSTVMIMPGESQAQYDEILNDLLAHYAPANAQENLLVLDLVRAYWFFLRAQRHEQFAMVGFNLTLQEEYGEMIATRTLDQLSKMTRYRASHERSYQRALTTLRKVQAERIREETRARSTAAKSKPAKPPLPDIGFVSQPPFSAPAPAHAASHAPPESTQVAA